MTLNKKRTIILIITLLALFFVTRLCDFEDKTFSYGHAVSNIKEQAKRVKLPKIKAYKKKSKKRSKLGQYRKLSYNTLRYGYHHSYSNWCNTYYW